MDQNSLVIGLDGRAETRWNQNINDPLKTQAGCANLWRWTPAMTQKTLLEVGSLADVNWCEEGWRKRLPERCGGGKRCPTGEAHSIYIPDSPLGTDTASISENPT